MKKKLTQQPFLKFPIPWYPSSVHHLKIYVANRVFARLTKLPTNYSIFATMM
jgi:hypothetical protein